MNMKLPWVSASTQNEETKRNIDWKRQITTGTLLVGGTAALYAVSTQWPDWSLGWAAQLGILTVMSAGLKRLTADLRDIGMRVKTVSGSESAKNAILTIRVDGPIIGEMRRGMVAATVGSPVVSGYDIQQMLIDAAKAKSIKAVLLQFSTPGGQVGGAEAICEGIAAYRKATSNPVIAHVEGLSASGGVYAMVEADEIYADPGSLIGSIGVTMGTHHYYDNPTSMGSGMFGSTVEARGGIKSYNITAGKGKDLLSPWRKPDEEEISTLRTQIDGVYDRFVEHVARCRSISESVIKDVMGAYVFNPEVAKSFGLIDGTKTRRQVLEYLAEKVGISDSYRVVRPQKKEGRISKLLGAEALCGVLALYNGPGSQAFFDGWDTQGH